MKILLATLFLVLCSALNIGILYSSRGIFGPFGQTVPFVYNYWLNNRKQPTPITSVFCDVESDVTKVAPCTDYVLDHNVSLIISPETFLTTATAAQVSVRQRTDIPIISGLAGTPDVFVDVNGNRRFNNLFGIMTPSNYYFRTLFPYLYLYDLTRVVILSTISEPDHTVCQGAQTTLGDYEGQIELIEFLTFNNDSQLYDQLSYLDKDIDIIVMCYRLGCQTSIQMLFDLDINAQALALFECAGSVNTLEPALAEKVKYIYTPQQWDQRLKGADYTDTALGLFPKSRNQTSAQYMFEAISAISPYPLSSLISSQTAAFYVIDELLDKCFNCSTSQLLNIVPTIYFRSFFGLIRFNRQGMNDGRDMTLVQVDRDYQLQVISPISSATSKPVIPAPRWSERIYQGQTYQSTIEIIYFILLALFNIFIIVVAALAIKYRNHRKLKALSKNFLLMSAIGMLWWSYAPLTWTINQVTDVCRLRLFMWVIPITLYIVPLIVKTIRINTIFNSNVIHFSKIDDMRLSQQVALIILLFIIITIIITAGPNYVNYIMEQPDINRPSLNYGACSVVTAGIYILLICFSFLILIGVYYAYRIRNTDKLYNDAKAMGYILYNLTFMATIIVICQLSLDDSNRYLLFGIRSIGLLAHLISSVIIYVERIINTELETDNKYSTSHNINIEVPVKISINRDDTVEPIRSRSPDITRLKSDITTPRLKTKELS